MTLSHANSKYAVVERGADTVVKFYHPPLTIMLQLYIYLGIPVPSYINHIR